LTGREEGGKEGEASGAASFCCLCENTVMAVYDIFSKRAKRRSGEQADVFTYDNLPAPVRVQLVNILRNLIGNPDSTNADNVYGQIHDAIAHELGRFRLAERVGNGDKLLDFVHRHQNVTEVLDVIEMALREMEHHQDWGYRKYAEATCSTADAAAEINRRFLENAIGFQYESGHMLQIDSQFAHAEIVKPALQLLSDPRYKGPQEEFLGAHKHYREGKYKECIVDCLKAFESTMKTILDKRGWTYSKNDTANALIQVCVQNKLIDPMLLSHVGALRTVLEAGVPTVRNRTSGHGQGATPVAVPAHYASYALHLTGANILFLVNSEKALP
jgi:hypothetical protein